MNILVMNFFPAFYPPTSGGELRYYNLYNELSKYHNVTLLSPTYSHHKLEEIQISPTFREFRVPKEEIRDKLHMELDNEDIGPEVSALVCALSANTPNLYHEYYAKLYPYADVIVHDFPYMLGYDLFFGIDNKPRIYNSHNYESYLVKQIWKGPNSNKYINFIRELEGQLVSKAEVVFTTSEEEKEKFIKDFNIHSDKIKLAPNGINPEEWKKNGVLKRDLTKKEGNRKTAFFIGSAHPPNIEAVQFIIENLAPRCQEVDFLIAGSCGNRFKDKVTPQNVKLLGLIDEKTKEDLFVTSDLAINPMFSGAGTNLKTLEYLSAGIPLISTECGVRGLQLENNKHFILADASNFSDTIQNAFQRDDYSLKELAEHGLDYINSNYSWASIAAAINENINNLIIQEKKPILLVLNDFECASPISGGEVRINKLYKSLSNRYKIALICLNSAGIIKKTFINEAFVEITIPKTKEQLDEEVKINKQHWISANDIVTYYKCEENKLLVGTIDCIYPLCDSIILTHPYMVKLIENKGSIKPVIYESHNFETDLKIKLLQGHPMFDFLISKVRDAEATSIRMSEFVVSVSDADHSGLKELAGDLSKRIYTIQNGVEITENKIANLQFVKNNFKGHPVVLFVGSSHQPNVEAAEFIVNELAIELYQCYFVVIGSVCDAITGIVPDNVLLFGRLDEEYKNALIQVSDIAINPMSSGSGSNLKIAEYFANKLPVVSTSFGARGFKITNMEHAIICELQEMSSEIQSLLDNKDLQVKLAERAYDYVKNELDWKVLANKYDGLLKSHIFRSGHKKRLLVVTYRFTQPPMGGAEAYMLNILKNLDSIGDFSIDVAAVNLKDLYNKYHFSIDGSYLNAEKSLGIFEDTLVHYFQADNLSDNVQLENSRKLYDGWMKESLEISLQHIDKYNCPMLLGGWYYPEKENGKYKVWSSEAALIYTNYSNMVIIKGISPKKKKVQIFDSNGHLLLQKNIQGDFEIILENTSDISYVKLHSEVHGVKTDPRNFGFILTKLIIENKEIPLISDYKYFMKEFYLEDYIDSLINVAKNRNDDYDALFQETRGPISTELEKWLDQNIKNYDIVLGHSVPFNTSVTAVKYAKKYNKPVIVLPHFHMEDEFYHWKSFYSAMNEATQVIAFPEKSIPSFFEKIGARTLSLPGGAVDPSEYIHFDDKAFYSKYTSNLPYILVLGRKTGSKNYKLAIDAIKEINRYGKKCNIVLIGKDEDFEPINEGDAIYLGEVDRKIVMSALKHCRCLVTMSESESFGMVILEAWMHGKPVIVNEKCAAFSELVNHNIDGLITNKERLVQNIELLLNDSDYANKLGDNGYKKVKDNFTWSMVSEKLNGYLSNLIK